jgi:hypothetical protein
LPLKQDKLWPLTNNKKKKKKKEKKEEKKRVNFGAVEYGIRQQQHGGHPNQMDL